MKLESCKKIADGRCVPPEVTIARLQPALERRHELRFLDEQVSDSLFWSAVFVDALDFRGMGKGIRLACSRAGALAESAEWLAALEVPHLKGYATGLAEDLADAIPLQAFLSHVADLTPETLRRVGNTACAQYWADAESLIDGATRKVPVEFVRRISGPNGRAAGNRIEEAILHAILEIFERRAQITTLRHRAILPTYDPASIRNPIIKAHLDFVRDQAIDVWIKDLSFGGILPCVGVYFRDPNIPSAFQFHHFFKVGSSFNREEALIRTFTEFVQGRRRDEFIANDSAAQARVLQHDFRALQCIENDGDNFLSSFMFGFVPTAQADHLRQGPVIPFDPPPSGDDCLDDIHQACRIVQTLRLDLLVTDFTDPTIGFPVVQVMVPGYSDVLPFHPRSSPILFREWTRQNVLDSYPHGFAPADATGTTPRHSTGTSP